MKETGTRIRLKRLEKNYSPEYMAAALKLSPAAYAKLESNPAKMTLNMLCRIAELLEVSLLEFFRDPGGPYTPSPFCSADQ